MAKRSLASIAQFIVIFFAVYLVTQYGLKFFFPKQFDPNYEPQGVVLQTVDHSISAGHHPILSLQNGTDKDLVLEDLCPMPPVLVWKVDENNNRTPLTTTETALPCEPLTNVPAGATVQIDLAPWKYSLFDEFGIYEVELPIDSSLIGGTPGTDASQHREGIIDRFTISEAGVVTQLFRTFISKPLLNLLIFIASVLPGHSLGWTIVLLTLAIKLILFFPTQHAMQGQRKMQLIQPKIEALRQKYKNDPKLLNQETMKLWKEEKVNPFQSCLPMMLQIPILIGLYYAIRDGSHLVLSQHLIYDFYQQLTWTFDTNFFGLDLTKPSPLWLFPPLLALAQFGQMKLSFAMAKRKKDALKKESDKPKEDEKAPASAQVIQQRMMTYMFPFLIAFFSLRLPAAVSIYWFVSTLFAIGQQFVVNRKTT